MESAVQASIIRIKDTTYEFSQLRQRTEHLENLDNEVSGSEDESSLGDHQLMVGIKDKGETPRIHTEIETIINNLQ